MRVVECVFGRSVKKKVIIDDRLQCLLNLKMSENLIVVKLSRNVRSVKRKSCWLKTVYCYTSHLELCQYLVASCMLYIV